jgi:predicted transcriptional regulator
MWDTHIKDGCRVKVANRGPFQSETEREMIGKTGRIVRAYVSSARVEIDGKPMMFSKATLDLVPNRKG